MKIKLYHPSKWAEDYYMDESCIPFKQVNDEFIELAPINVPTDFKPRVFKLDEVEITFS